MANIKSACSALLQQFSLSFCYLVCLMGIMIEEALLVNMSNPFTLTVSLPLIPAIQEVN